MELTPDGATVIGAPDTEKDPVKVYALDNTGWNELALYLWGDKELGGGWPGLQVEGTREIAGQTFKVFTVPDAMGRAEHLIFNNNNNGVQLPDLDITFSEQELYVQLTPNGASIIPAPQEGQSSVWYVKNSTGWGENLRFYAWGNNLPELFGGWPGAAASENVTIGGEPYAIFRIGGEFWGSTYNVIPNNKVPAVPESEQVQYDGPAVTISSDYFMDATSSALTITKGVNKIRIYVQDESGWGENLRVYAWGNNLPELFGGWPGAAASGTEEIGGKQYKYFDIAGSNFGLEYNLIFNNQAEGVPEAEKTQFDGPKVTVDRDHYLVVTSSSAVPVN